MEQYLEGLKKNLFKSKDRTDWIDKDAWIRRAIFWKMMAMGLESNQLCNNKNLKKVYEGGLGGDLIESPQTDAIKAIANISIPLFNDRNKNKIILAKG